MACSRQLNSIVRPDIFLRVFLHLSRLTGDETGYIVVFISSGRPKPSSSNRIALFARILVDWTELDRLLAYFWILDLLIDQFLFLVFGQIV